MLFDNREENDQVSPWEWREEWQGTSRNLSSKFLKRFVVKKKRAYPFFRGRLFFHYFERSRSFILTNNTCRCAGHITRQILHLIRNKSDFHLIVVVGSAVNVTLAIPAATGDMTRSVPWTRTVATEASSEATVNLSGSASSSRKA